MLARLPPLIHFLLAMALANMYSKSQCAREWSTFGNSISTCFPVSALTLEGWGGVGGGGGGGGANYCSPLHAVMGESGLDTGANSENQSLESDGRVRPRSRGEPGGKSIENPKNQKWSKGTGIMISLFLHQKCQQWPQ